MNAFLKALMVLSVLSLSAYASDDVDGGKNIDLRNQFSSVMNRITVKNQGKYGLCYAYAGSALIDFIRFQQTDSTEEISPLASGVIGTIFREKQDEEGGDICDVVNGVSRFGKVCSRISVGEESRYREVGLYFHREAVNRVLLKFLIKEIPFEPVSEASFQSRQGLTKNQKKYLDKFDDFYSSLKSELRKRKFSESSIPSAIKIFQLTQSSHAENKYYILAPSFTKLLLKQACADKAITVPKVQCETKQIARMQMINEIDHQLEVSHRPVGISYCSKVLNDMTSIGIDYYNKPKKDCGSHASLVVGKRKIASGEYQYLIRNSWGIKHDYPWETSRGDIWISQRAMLNNTYAVHVIE